MIMKVFIPQTASPVLHQIAACMQMEEVGLTTEEKQENPFWIRTLRRVVESCKANRIQPKTVAFTSVSNGYSLSLDGECVSFLMEKEVVNG